MEASRTDDDRIGAPSSTTEVSVIIPLRNGAGTLGEQLKALAAQDYSGSWELIIADNGSTDDGPLLLEAWSHPSGTARVVDASRTPGVSFARNNGANAACGDLLIFCDSDDIVRPGWLAAMVSAARDFDMVGGALEVVTLNSFDARTARPDTQLSALSVGLGFLPYGIGANFSVTKQAFLEIGGWNEQYRAGGDDIDFCWRGQYAGFRLGFSPDAVISYRYRDGLRPLTRQYYRYGMMEPLLYREHRSKGMPPRSWKQVLWSYWWFVLHIGDLWRSRASRHAWIRTLAYRAGRVRGSLRFRSVYL